MKAFVLYVILKIYRLVIKVKTDVSFDIENYPQPLIFAFWHESILFLSFAKPKKRTINILISTHKDGKLASDVVKYFNLGTVGGSSNREPTKAFFAMLKSIKNNKTDIGITPDGPKGPRRKLKRGIIELAYLSKMPIVPIVCCTTNAWRVHSWDRMLIPKPFSTVVFKFLNPLCVNSKDEFDQKAEELETLLNEC